MESPGMEADALRTLTFGSLFAGIGGLDLGLERAGMVCRWQVENDPYAQKVLAKHWPHITRYEDVRDFPASSTERVDIIAGGFPCQDVSHAGKRKGLSGERSGLFFEMMRVVRVLRPSYVVIENVSGLLTDFGLATVLGDLNSLGFDAEWTSLLASDFGLPHKRQRTFIVAYTNGQHGAARVGTEPDWSQTIFGKGLGKCDVIRIQAPDPTLRGDHGLSQRFYRHRGRAVGNAVAVPVAEYIGRQIVKFHKATGETVAPESPV
jgi:DNA (cytosine-5)-methyltransferase 1